MGNLHSVIKKLNKVKVNSIITSDPEVIKRADKLILPGVGHFGKAMENITRLNLSEVLNEAIIIKKKPILGICLGMQLFSRSSEEGNVSGLGWIDAEVVRFRIMDKLKFKIPHTGWNQIRIMNTSLLMKDIQELSEFYFVHSFHYKCNNPKDILNLSEYEYEFVSAIEKENIFGVQYHPEKSHDNGELLLRNFVNL
jgi:glutamine amidotransferase